ncbi:MAG: hypothetical protein HY884_01380 [Deltaproteobacteria bacterium]|nr:hypothetical protein [Deltaproteobacteria bacterium]
MRLRSPMLVLAATFILASCGLRINPPEIALTGKPRAAYNGAVKVYWDDKLPPDMRYEEIGIVSAQCLVARCQWVQILKALQKKAAYYGGNAIIVKYKETPLHKTETKGASGAVDPDKAGQDGQAGYSSETFTGKDMLAVAIRLD